ncbi:MAG: hypothetical protein CVV56_03590 [Tenericutes bacterium HGW-Tenericutes-1]|jgi:ribosomal protein S18 acetylase RimI-like enzyme|nr:MAG: hypothetical protein CVV56_03590 [Tenericutes bacterium HGW-Tenericutes-1]
MVRLSDYTKEYEQVVSNFSLFPDQKGYAIDPSTLFSTYSQDEDKAMCVVLYEERPCGAVLVQATAPKEYQLLSLMLDKDYQKRGIGKLAMLDLVQKMKNRKANKVTTKISKDNLRAIDFLQRSGFKIKEETDNSLILVMEIYYD